MFDRVSNTHLLSDFHEMFVTLKNLGCKYRKSKTIQRRSCKNFSLELFDTALNNELSNTDINNAQFSEL